MILFDIHDSSVSWLFFLMRKWTDEMKIFSFLSFLRCNIWFWRRGIYLSISAPSYLRIWVWDFRSSVFCFFLILLNHLLTLQKKDHGLRISKLNYFDELSFLITLKWLCDFVLLNGITSFSWFCVRQFVLVDNGF